MLKVRRGSVQHRLTHSASGDLFFIPHKQQIVRPRFEDHHRDLLFTLLHKVGELLIGDADRHAQ